MEATCPPEIRRAWRYIFETFERPTNINDYSLFELKSSVKIDGWTNATVREFARTCSPRLTVKRPWSRPKPPSRGTEFDTSDIIELDVEYPEIPIDIYVVDDYLERAVREFRKNLEHAVSLETELGGAGLSLLVPIEPDSELDGLTSDRGFKISGAFLFYVSLFKRLVEKDASAAKQECLAWRIGDDTVFAALRIWACGNQRIFSSEEAGEIICLLNDHVFWHGPHQRDLLLVLSRRWSEFPAIVKTNLGNRVLYGPPQWDGEEIDHYLNRRAWSSLTRIEWLRSHGCTFEFDVDSECAKLRVLAPKWQPEYAQRAAASLETRGGIVRTDTQYEALLNVPLAKVLEKSMELRARDTETLIEKDPFAGLACSRPMRAFSALTIAGKRKEYPRWAWRTFLNGGSRQSDKPKLSALIAARLARLPSRILAENIYSVCDWLLTSSGVLLASFPTQFERLWTEVISVLRSDAEVAKSSIVRGNKEPDWPMEGLNAPVGKLAQVLLNDPIKDCEHNQSGFPSRWISRVNELLLLEGDLRRHALVIFARGLNWFFARDQAWTEEHLLSALNHNIQDQNAFWAGFFWGGQVPEHALFYRLKPQLLELVKNSTLKRYEYITLLAGIILAGWKTVDITTGERYVTNEEMRDILVGADEGFRSSLLWHLERSSNAQEEYQHWAKRVFIFLTEIWPRQKKVKTSRMTAKLVKFALSSPDLFPEVIDAILPLLTKIDETTRHDLLRLEDKTVKKHPKKTLALLSAILPENASIWPYGIEDVLEMVGIAEPHLLNDPRLVELKRQWNSR
jgi:hypothetical protein